MSFYIQGLVGRGRSGLNWGQFVKSDMRCGETGRKLLRKVEKMVDQQAKPCVKREKLILKGNKMHLVSPGQITGFLFRDFSFAHYWGWGIFHPIWFNRSTPASSVISILLTSIPT